MTRTKLFTDAAYGLLGFGGRQTDEGTFMLRRIKPDLAWMVVGEQGDDEWKAPANLLEPVELRLVELGGDAGWDYCLEAKSFKNSGELFDYFTEGQSDVLMLDSIGETEGN
jgi:hypothetical protein